MATKKVQPVDIVLDIKGKEKLSSLNSSFRDLSKQTKLADKDIVQATKDIVNFSKDLNISEATIKGQIKALEGLREQAAMGGKVYRSLSRNIEELESNLRGSTDAVEKKRERLVELAAQSKNNAAALAKVVTGLQKLKSSVREDSAAYRQLNSDIEKTNKSLTEVNVTAAKARFTINQALAVKPEKIVPQIKRIQAAIASGTLEAQDLARALLDLELLNVGAGRAGAVRKAQAFDDRIGKRYLDSLRKNYEDLAKTSAIISQRISEVNTELANVTGYERRRALTIELINLNKELRNAVVNVRTAEEFQGLAIRQRMGRARESYAESGFGAFSADIRQRTAAGEFTPGMQRAQERVRLAEQEAQEMEQIAELQKVINNLADEHVESLRSAARTISEYEQKLGDDIVRRYEEETAAQNQAYQNRIANDEDAFRKELERVNILSQARKAAASALGMGGREDISSLYQGIIGLSTADIRRQQEMMGKTATEVFNDIATAFEKGGRAVDLKRKSTSIGDDIAEGVAKGASSSNEISKGAKDFASRLIAAYKKAFRIQSPSKETEQEVGIPLGLGIIKGLISALRSNKRKVQKEIENIVDPGIPRSRQPRRLIGTVQDTLAITTGPSRARATRSRAAMPGYRPLGSNVRLDNEIERMFNQFRVNIAAVTTDAEIYYNLLQSLPSSKITTNIAGLASRRARAAEVPGFMAAQRVIGPGDLEREIATSVAEHLKSIRTPDPWVGVTGDYQKFIDSIVSKTQEVIRLREYLERFTVSRQGLLSGTRIAGALPPARIGYAADPSRIDRLSRLGEVRALPPAQRRFGELQDPGVSMFTPAGTPREYQKMAALLAEASSSPASSRGFIRDVGFGNLPVDVTGLSGFALTDALASYSRQARGLGRGDYSSVMGLFPGASGQFRGGVTGKYDFGGQHILPLEERRLALPSAEMRQFEVEIQHKLRRMIAEARGGSTGSHFHQTPIAGLLPAGAGGGGGRGVGAGVGAGGGGGRSFFDIGGENFGRAGDFKFFNDELKKFGNLGDASTNRVRGLGASLKNLQDILDPLGADFNKVNEAITKQSSLIDRELQKRERRMSRRRMSPMQMTQAAGAVLSGGIFGGPEGFIGGAIGALGGVGGAFAGAAIGAQVGGIRRTLGEYTEYAAQIARLKIALEGIAGSQDQYNRALAAAADVTKSLNVPQDVAIQGITRLTAAVKGAGGGVADAELAFKNINSAIIATGGGAEQVQGAVTALVQIFSKGKVSAEEINQIAERLPGTFNKIAEASGRTGPELTKALQDGKVGLNDLMKFLVSLGDEYGELAGKIAGSSENAGARLQTAFNQMRIEVGNALQPIGAEFQDAFTEFIKDVTPTLVAVLPKIGELALGLMKNLTQLAQAASGLASFAVRLAAINLALKGFAALKGPVSTMFILLKSGFRASSQQAALAQGKLIAFGTTVRTLAASLAAPVVITFAVVGAEMVISYFNRIKKAREDLEATAKKPQGEVFFQSIGGTAATKQTLQRNINDITKNLDILRDRVKSTKEEIASYQKTVDTFDPGERASGLGVPAPAAKEVPEDLKTRLQADEAEIKRLVLNYRTLIDKYLDAPDRPGLTVFDEPKPDGTGTGTGGTGKGKETKVRQSRLGAIQATEQLLGVEKQILDNARQIRAAQADSNFERVNQLNNQKISLEFAKRAAESQFELNEALARAAGDKNEAALKAEAFAKKEISDKLLLIQYEAALADEAQRRAFAEEERSKAMSDQLFTLREQLGLVTDDERIARFRQEQEKQFGQDDPRVAEATDLFRQTVAPTFAEGLSQKMRELKKDLKELVNPINQVAFAADTIGTAFGKAFSDVVTGSASAKEALAGMMQSIGQSFIEMAAQIIAKQTTMIILGTIMKALGIAGAASGGFESAPLGEGFSSGATPSSFDAVGAGIFTPKANGGPVRGGQAYMVGERGPELFVPSTNGGVMRNEDMRRLMGRSPAGVGSQPAMNFTFETTNIGGTEYVSREQLEAAMATTRRQAANDGAKRGMNMTLDRMQNSPRTRARVGIS